MYLKICTNVSRGGFSQGGAMSLFTGVTCPHKLGGIVGLSSYLLLHNKLKDILELLPGEPPNKDTPIFMGHGDSDPLVKHEWGQLTAKILTELGFTVDFHTYRYVRMNWNHSAGS